MDWPAALGAATLFVDDVAAGRPFYGDVLGLPLVFEDDESDVWGMGGTLINRLQEAASLGCGRPAFATQVVTFGRSPRRSPADACSR